MANRFKRLTYPSHRIAEIQHGVVEWKKCDGVTFELLYTSAQKCIYALKCPKINASDSSKHKDLYSRVRVTNSEIFRKPVDYREGKYAQLYSIVQDLRNNDEVVAAGPVLEVIEEVKKEVSPSPTTIEFKLAIEKISVSIKKFTQKTTAELQLNTWFYDKVINVLQREFGLIVHAHKVDYCIPDSKICVYGTSQPDLSFYPPVCDPRIAFGGTVMPLREGYLIGGMVEFKALSLIGYNQVCANMVRVASHIAEEYLKAGRDLDFICIMGILVSHTRAQCIPLRLDIDFTDDTSIFTEGDISPFADGGFQYHQF